MDNFTKFPNAILEALISGRYTEMQITAVLYIVRKTYGWNKARDSISIKKMAEETGYARRAMLRTITQLEELNIISVERPGIGKTGTMNINSPDRWNKPVTTRSHVTTGSQCPPGHKGVTTRSQGGVTTESHVPVTTRSHTKYTKDTSKYKTKESFSLAGKRTDDERSLQTDSTDVCDGSWNADALADVDLTDDSLWT